MIPQPDDYRPVASVREILDVLQEQGMAWIANEIAEHLREGRTLSEPETLFGRQPARSQSHATVPFDEDEQLRITLMTILRYTIETFDTWNDAVRRLRDTLGSADVEVEITQPDSQDILPLFLPGYGQQVEEVAAWARGLWPDGSEQFDQMLTQLRGEHQ